MSTFLSIVRDIRFLFLFTRYLVQYLFLYWSKIHAYPCVIPDFFIFSSFPWPESTTIDFRLSETAAMPLPLLTFRVDLQRNHGFGLPMAVPRYYGIRPREVEFRVRYFQTVLRSFADQPEVGCVLVVIGLKNEKSDWDRVKLLHIWLIISELSIFSSSLCVI